MEYDEFTKIVAQAVASEVGTTNQDWLDKSGLPEEALIVILNVSKEFFKTYVATKRDVDTALSCTALDMFALGWTLALASFGHATVGPLNEGSEN